MDLERVFPEVRMRIKKRMFGDEVYDEVVNLTAEERFKSEFFIILFDAAISSIKTRFDQLSNWLKVFGFLYNAETMVNLIKRKASDHIANGSKRRWVILMLKIRKRRWSDSFV